MKYSSVESISGLFHSIFMFLLALSCVFLYSCISTSSDICDVCQNPSEYQNPITLKGTVTESSGILGYSIFTIKDKMKDCKLMVLSKKISPSLGKSIKIKGTLKELSNINNNRKLIFVEEGVDFEEIKDLITSNYGIFLNQ